METGLSSPKRGDCPSDKLRLHYRIGARAKSVRFWEWLCFEKLPYFSASVCIGRCWERGGICDQDSGWVFGREERWLLGCSGDWGKRLSGDGERDCERAASRSGGSAGTGGVSPSSVPAPDRVPNLTVQNDSQTHRTGTLLQPVRSMSTCRRDRSCRVALFFSRRR